MVNDKTHLYGLEDANKDRKNTEKKRDQQQFSRFSRAFSSALNTAGLEPKAPATQIDTKVQIGFPYDDTKGSVGPSTQLVNFDVYGSNYTFYEVTGDVDFAFNELPTGRHITFTLDILVNQAAGVTLGFPTVTNPPVLAGNDGDRYVLEFIAVNRTDPTGVNPPVQTITFLSGATAGGVSFPLTPDINARGNVSTVVDIDLSAITAHYQEMTLIGGITLTFSNPPADDKEISFILDITQDATGNHTVAWPLSVRNIPVVGLGANDRTVIIVTTVDNGTNYDALIVTGGTVNAANKQLSNISNVAIPTSLISDTDNTDDLGSVAKKWKDLHIGGIANIATLAATTMGGDLNMGTFDIFNVDIVQFALGGASLLSTDVGFDANVNGGITTNILTDVGGNWKVTEEGTTRLFYDTANNAFQVQDVNPLISLQETGTSTAFTISKIAGRTDISEPTEIQFQIAVTNIFEVLSTGITMADNKFIANVDQIGFRNIGNFIEDDASGLRLITVPTDFVMMGDGTNTFMTVQNTHFDIGGRYWQLNAMASPGVTGSSSLGRVFIDSGNSNHLSIIRNAAIIDLEAGGTNEFVDTVFRIIGSVDDTSKLAFEVDGIAIGTTRTWTAQDASGTVALLDGAVTQITINNWDFQGNVILGNTNADTISCLGLFDRDILSDVAGRNVGGAGNEWLSIFLSGNVYLGTTTTQRIFADAAGMEFHVPITNTFEWKIDAITEMEMTNTGAIDHKGNLVFNVSAYEFGSGARRIAESGSDLEYNVGTGGVHGFEINNVDILNIGLSTVDFIQGSIDLQDATESFIQYREILNPATPIAARARQFLGVAGGKQELRIKWDDGVVTVIATQP